MMKEILIYIYKVSQEHWTSIFIYQAIQQNVKMLEAVLTNKNVIIEIYIG